MVHIYGMIFALSQSRIQGRNVLYVHWSMVDKGARFRRVDGTVVEEKQVHIHEPVEPENCDR